MEEQEIVMQDNPLEIPLTFRERLSRFRLRISTWWAGLGKKRYVLSGLIVLMVVIGVGLWVQSANNTPVVINSKQSQDNIFIAEPSEPLSHEIPLTGIKVTQEEYDKVMAYLPMAVMVENLSSVRPVSGLSEADLVFEALVEGGITRYMAVFHSQQADEIMPVRSSRAYYLDWINPLDATYMHIGGAISDNPRAAALPRIFNEGIKTYMNVYGSWWRKPEIAAPHNAFTSTQRMKDAQEKQGWATTPNIQTWQYKEDEIPVERPNEEKKISLLWNNRGENGYNVDWVYDPIGNRYFYEVGSVRQTDASTGDDVTAKNVIMQLSLQTLANDQYGHILYDTIGEGRALIFRDGEVIEGIWKKPDVDTRTRFYAQGDEEIKFNRGLTWVQIVPDNSEITY